MTDEKEDDKKLANQENNDHTDSKESEKPEDTVDDVINNITIQIGRLEIIQSTQEEKAASFREQIVEITNMMTAALFERARAKRIARKMHKLIA